MREAHRPTVQSVKLTDKEKHTANSYPPAGTKKSSPACAARFKPLV
jgi:hypothetical protein